MLCKVCRHCGLCEGDGTFSVDKNALVVATGIYSSHIPADESCTPNEIGIAVDLGTTTLALRAFSLRTGKLLSKASAENALRAYGSDVISRVSYAASDEGLSELNKTLLLQLSSLIDSLVREASAALLSKRVGRASVTRMVFCGNTTMQRLFAKKTMEGLSSFPFAMQSEFGMSFPASDFFPELSFLSCAEVFVSPTVSAFVGGDSVCAMLATFFSEKKSTGKALLCDLGTNCEIALYDYEKNTVTCTSCAAGPAFEAQGISCGMSATEGAVTQVDISSSGSARLRVIGGGEAKGFCGTGLLSALSALRKNNLLTAQGEFASGEEKFYFSKNVFLSQKDVRNFQLAKGAVRTGIDFLCEAGSITPEEKLPLYLVGGFGTKLSVQDILSVGMIPRFLLGDVRQTGNAALDGASLLLTNLSLRKDAVSIAKKSTSLNLAESPEFQRKFLESLSLNG